MKKKFSTLLLSLALLFFSAGTPLGMWRQWTSSAEIIDSGTCGDESVNNGNDVEWKLETNGGNVTVDGVEKTAYTLTIIGSGAMKESLYSSCPWRDYKSSITAVVVAEGVTSLSECAFQDCSSLKTVSLPATLASAGDVPFDGCYALSSITLAAGNAAFEVSNNGALLAGTDGTLVVYAKKNSNQHLVVPAGVKKIPSQFFNNVQNVTSVSLPASVETIGWGAFSNMPKVKTMVLLPSVTSVGKSAFGSSGVASMIFYENSFFLPDAALHPLAIPARLAYTVEGSQDGKTAVTITSASKAATIACDAMGDNYVISGVAAGVPVTLTHDMPDALCTSACSFCGVTAGELDPTTHALSDVVISEPKAEKLGAVHSMCSRCDYDVFSHYTLGDGASPTMYPDGTRLSDASYTPKATNTFDLNGQELTILLQDPLGVLGSGTLGLEVHQIDLPGDFDGDVDVEHAHAYEIVPVVDGVKVSGSLSNKVRLLYKIPQGWDRADLEVFLAQAGEDREFDEVTEKIGDDEYLVAWTDQFSPYVFVDKLKPEEKAALETLQDADGSNGDSNTLQGDAGNSQTNGAHSIRTGDASGELLMLSTLAMIATGLYLGLFLKKKSF